MKCACSCGMLFMDAMRAKVGTLGLIGSFDIGYICVFKRCSRRYLCLFRLQHTNVTFLGTPPWCDPILSIS